MKIHTQVARDSGLFVNADAVETAEEIVVTELATGTSTVDDAATAELVGRVVRHAPGAPPDWLIALGADAVAAELARQAR